MAEGHHGPLPPHTAAVAGVRRAQPGHHPHPQRRRPAGEHDRLRDRISILFDKLETQLKQALREKRLREGQGFQLDETMLANLLLAYAEGRISQFVRSEFKLKPTARFEDQWQFMRSQLLQS